MGVSPEGQVELVATTTRGNAPASGLQAACARLPAHGSGDMFSGWFAGHGFDEADG